MYPPLSHAHYALLYARVSSKDQEKEGSSIPAQQELLRSYASANGFTIVQQFVDVETAKQAGRASFGEMIAFLKKHSSCRVILVNTSADLSLNRPTVIERRASISVRLSHRFSRALTSSP